jgi:hypothetical protein
VTGARSGCAGEIAPQELVVMDAERAKSLCAMAAGQAAATSAVPTADAGVNGRAEDAHPSGPSGQAAGPSAAIVEVPDQEQEAAGAESAQQSQHATRLASPQEPVNAVSSRAAEDASGAHSIDPAQNAAATGNSVAVPQQLPSVLGSAGPGPSDAIGSTSAAQQTEQHVSPERSAGAAALVKSDLYTAAMEVDEHQEPSHVLALQASSEPADCPSFRQDGRSEAVSMEGAAAAAEAPDRIGGADAMLLHSQDVGQDAALPTATECSPAGVATLPSAAVLPVPMTPSSCPAPVQVSFFCLFVSFMRQYYSTGLMFCAFELLLSKGPR